MSAERALWAAVIETAVKDYRSGPGGWLGSNRANNYRTAVGFLRSRECRDLLVVLDIDAGAFYQALRIPA